MDKRFLVHEALNDDLITFFFYKYTFHFKSWSNLRELNLAVHLFVTMMSTQVRNINGASGHILTLYHDLITSNIYLFDAIKTMKL